jgi:hypothetical protein
MPQYPVGLLYQDILDLFAAMPPGHDHGQARFIVYFQPNPTNAGALFQGVAYNPVLEFYFLLADYG